MQRARAAWALHACQLKTWQILSDASDGGVRNGSIAIHHFHEMPGRIRMRTRLSAALLCGLTISMPSHAQTDAARDFPVVRPTNGPPVRPPAPLAAPSLDLVRVTDVRRLAPDGGE